MLVMAAAVHTRLNMLTIESIDELPTPTTSLPASVGTVPPTFRGNMIPCTVRYRDRFSECVVLVRLGLTDLTLLCRILTTQVAEPSETAMRLVAKAS